ncbi:MAG: 3-hydroxyacyl-CoA dehydrogenase family protein [Nostocoides sp.]
MSTVAVVGSGTMGAGIAQVSAMAGHDVVLHDVGQPQLDRATDAITDSLTRLVAKDRLTEEAKTEALGRIRMVTDLAELADADIVIEAAFEDLEVKQEIFTKLDAICKPGAVLASNTSALPITQIAAATQRPESVVGTHFFSPVPMMALCELVRGVKTTDETLATARDFAESVGKTCIVVNRDIAGFVTTRIIVAMSVEAARLVETGVATAEDVDTACRLGFGHAMGPLETMDLTGVDVFVKASRNIYRDTADPKFSPPELTVRMDVAGDLGRKSGRGWYSYS